MIGLILVAAATIPGENRARIGELEVVGPVRDLSLSLGQAGESRIEGALLDGERLRLEVPLAARGAPSIGVVPRIAWPAEDPAEIGGSARFLAWSEDETRLSELPLGILSRPRPPSGPTEIAQPLAALALLPACFLLAILARERRATSILISLAGAALCLGLSARARGGVAAGATVLEMAEGSDLALEVRASFATATVEATDLPATALEVDPEGARVVWIGSFSTGSPWQARSPGAALYLLRARDPDGRRFSRAANGVTDLAESWVREAGEWTVRGAWTLDSPLPPPRPGPPPPGWLSSGLPQGVPVLLGRMAAGAGGRGEAWIRLTGFE